MIMFEDRADAGEKLGLALRRQKLRSAVVYALPRGGVVVGAEAARTLNAPLEILVARKIGRPSWEEYAIGAVTESGEPVWNEAEHETLDPGLEEQLVKKERSEAKRRRLAYIGSRKTVNPRGKTAIIVDDGIATGLTMRAAAKELRTHQPKEIIIAVPVGPEDALEELQEYADKVVTLQSVPSSSFGAVGSFYNRFEQTQDDEVQEIMTQFAKE